MYTISVIIPCYNRLSFLPRCLDSVFNQTRPADEIIVIDDGSTDGTAQFIKQQYPQLTLIQQTHQGVSVARNRGIQHAKGNWIALLDSDDEWLPDKLAKQEANIPHAQDCALIHTDEIWIRNGIRVNAMKKHQKQGGYIFEHCLPLCCISPSSVLIRQDIFDKIGFFDEQLPACEDYDLWLRICHRWPVFLIQTPLLIKYGGHDDQLSRQYWGMDRFRIHALHKLLETGTLSPKNQQLTQNMLIKKINLFLNGAKKHNNTEYLAEFSQLLYKYTIQEH